MRLLVQIEFTMRIAVVSARWLMVMSPQLELPFGVGR